jgi:hypothetical protein
MVNPPRVRFGAVGAGEGLGVGSLILTPVGFFFVTFLAFLGADGVVATLNLPARVLDDPVLGPCDDALTDLTLRVQAERGTAGIGVSPSKSGIGSMKSSRVCNQTSEE